MSKSGNLWRKIHGKVTKRPTNFGWLINDKLAGSGMPTTASELDWVLKQGVRSIITMTEEPLPKSWIKDVKYLHMPTEDLSAPDMEKIDQAVDFIHKRIQSNEPVMVHCAAGIGRTGTVLACYLVKYQKMSFNDAIEKVRKERPGSIQSESQELAVSLYYKFVHK
ncbi:MAG: protein tyrosine phosphatase [Thaumarchaeota archaeon]|nr:MAG: protein tyrosine phosphatase [Nitrososphaerota archaeon]TLX96387.1 MAG: protein tyrosine phosphatase [Nitrososphaerota archaeon]